MAVIEDIGAEKDPYAVPPLLNALKDSEAKVREGAVTALGWLQAPKAISGLKKALKDPDARVCWAAVSALRRLRK